MKFCKHCGKSLAATYSERVDNAKRSREKAKMRGTKMGRPKIRNDELIIRLHKEGKSYSTIAAATGVSTGAVQRALKAMGE